jgi:hypothetical protein
MAPSPFQGSPPLGDTYCLPSVNDAFDIGSPEFLFILLEKNINITSIHYEKEIAKIALKSF